MRPPATPPRPTRRRPTRPRALLIRPGQAAPTTLPAAPAPGGGQGDRQSSRQTPRRPRRPPPAARHLPPERKGRIATSATPPPPPGCPSCRTTLPSPISEGQAWSAVPLGWSQPNRPNDRRQRGWYATCCDATLPVDPEIEVPSRSRGMVPAPRDSGVLSRTAWTSQQRCSWHRLDRSRPRSERAHAARPRRGTRNAEGDAGRRCRRTGRRSRVPAKRRRCGADRPGEGSGHHRGSPARSNRCDRRRGAGGSIGRHQLRHRVTRREGDLLDPGPAPTDGLLQAPRPPRRHRWWLR